MQPVNPSTSPQFSLPNSKWHDTMPYLQRDELSRYFKDYKEVKGLGFDAVKKRVADSIANMLKENIIDRKPLIKPSQTRNSYVELYKWLVTRLQAVKLPEYYAELSTLQYIDQQKTIIVSGYLQLLDLIGLQCRQKSQTLRILFSTSLQLINTLLIQLQSTTSSTILTHLQQRNTEQKQQIDKLTSLQQTITLLHQQKTTKCNNLPLIIKDNRVMRRQNRRLIRMLGCEQEKVHALNEEVLMVRKENERFRLVEGEGGKSIGGYLEAMVQIERVERLVRKYPQRAREVARRELKSVEVEEGRRLEGRVQGIIKAIEEEGITGIDGDIEEEEDDFLDTNKVIMTFNIYTQTDTDYKDTATNTITPPSSTTSTQVPLSRLSKPLKLHNPTISQQILPSLPAPAKRCQQRKGKTINMTGQEKQSPNTKSHRQIDSIKRFLLQDGNLLSSGLRQVQTVNVRVNPRSESVQAINTKTSLFYNRRRRSEESEGSGESGEESQRSRGDRQKVRFCQVDRGENMHTVSSKSKTKECFHIADSDQWKVSKVYCLSTRQSIKTSQNVFVSTPEDRILKKKPFLASFSHRNLLANGLISHLKINMDEQEQISDRMEQEMLMREQINLAKNRHISQLTLPSTISKRFFQEQQSSRFFLQPQPQQSTPQSSPNPLNTHPPPNFHPSTRPLSKDPSKLNPIRRQRNQSQQSISSIASTNPYFEGRFLTQQQEQKPVEASLFFSKKPGKRASESTTGVNLNSLKAKKCKRQASFVVGAERRVGRVLGGSLGSRVGEQKGKGHLRTRTQGIELIEQTAQQTQMATSKDLRLQSTQHLTTLPLLHKISQVQSEFQQTLKPHPRFFIPNLTNLQNLDTLPPNITQQQQPNSTIDLMKATDRLIKNIAQRSTQIIKKDYLFKQFLLSFYQLQYGPSTSLKTHTTFLKQLKHPRHCPHPTVQCLNLLMNDTCPSPYLRDIFRLFTVLIDKNGGSLTDHAGEHRLYRKIVTELLQIFVDEEGSRGVVQGLCLEQLGGSLGDYFVAVEGEVRRRSLGSGLYAFFVRDLLGCAETMVRFELIREVTFFVVCSDVALKNKLIELRMYADPSIELHRLCLVSGKLNFKELLEIGSLIERKHNEHAKMASQEFNPNKLMNLLAKQRFESFPCLKQILHRQIERFYKYNVPISEPLLKLCHLTLLSEKYQKELPISDCLKVINETTEKLERVKHYKRVLMQNGQR